MKKIISFLVNVIFCKLLYRVKYVYNENVPKIKDAVICANHSNFKDPIFIYPKFRNLKIMAKEELFKNKLLGRIFTKLGAFPIKRGKKDAKSIIHAINIFKKDRDLSKPEEEVKMLIFPEGTRVDEIDLEAAKLGAVYIALKAGVHIIPTYITPKPKLFSKVLVIFKEPIYVDQSKSKDKEYLKELSDKILKIIYDN